MRPNQSIIILFCDIGTRNYFCNSVLASNYNNYDNNIKSFILILLKEYKYNGPLYFIRYDTAFYSYIYLHGLILALSLSYRYRVLYKIFSHNFNNDNNNYNKLQG